MGKGVNKRYNSFCYGMAERRLSGSNHLKERGNYLPKDSINLSIHALIGLLNKNRKTFNSSRTNIFSFLHLIHFESKTFVHHNQLYELYLITRERCLEKPTIEGRSTQIHRLSDLITRTVCLREKPNQKAVKIFFSTFCFVFIFSDQINQKSLALRFDSLFLSLAVVVYLIHIYYVVLGFRIRHKNRMIAPGDLLIEKSIRRLVKGACAWVASGEGWLRPKLFSPADLA